MKFNQTNFLKSYDWNQPTKTQKLENEIDYYFQIQENCIKNALNVIIIIIFKNKRTTYGVC